MSKIWSAVENIEKAVEDRTFNAWMLDPSRHVQLLASAKARPPKDITTIKELEELEAESQRDRDRVAGDYLEFAAYEWAPAIADETYGMATRKCKQPNGACAKEWDKYGIHPDD